MNKALTKALLSAALLTSGVIGAGSVIAQAGNGTDAATPVVATAEAAAPAGLQTIDDPADDATSTDDVVDSDDGADRGDGRGCGNSEAIAETLGLTTDELGEARDGGSTIAEIATTQGVDVDEVVQAIVDGKAERLEEKVAAGDLTEDEAAERLADAEANAVDKVNDES
ncbi:hypothetical protein [Ilumatobacter sp.]|uniref:hypothetical protein n=1 Tax=Ilumatobacter sp. TaxID=1967498 RepID=UPI003C4CFA0B